MGGLSEQIELTKNRWEDKLEYFALRITPSLQIFLMKGCWIPRIFRKHLEWNVAYLGKISHGHLGALVGCLRERPAILTSPHHSCRAQESDLAEINGGWRRMLVPASRLSNAFLNRWPHQHGSRPSSSKWQENFRFSKICDSPSWEGANFQQTNH